MPKPNYQRDKRQRDLARQHKQEEKRQKKLAKGQDPQPADAAEATPAAEEGGTDQPPSA